MSPATSVTRLLLETSAALHPDGRFCKGFTFHPTTVCVVDIATLLVAMAHTSHDAGRQVSRGYQVLFELNS